MPNLFRHPIKKGIKATVSHLASRVLKQVRDDGLEDVSKKASAKSGKTMVAKYLFSRQQGSFGQSGQNV
jgi:hypothetical protein